MPSEKEIIWTAGLLEGEGSFMVRSDQSGITVSCAMTDEDVINKLKNVWGGSIYYRSNEDKENWKESYRWQISNQEDCLELCKSVLPYMGNRRSSQIKECIEERKRIESVKKQERQRIKSRNEKIRRDYNTGDYTYESLAEKYDLGRSTIGAILNPENYRYNY